MSQNQLDKMIGKKDIRELCINSLYHVEPETLINFEKLQVPSLLASDNHTINAFLPYVFFCTGIGANVSQWQKLGNCLSPQNINNIMHLLWEDNLFPHVYTCTVQIKREKLKMTHDSQRVSPDHFNSQPLCVSAF